MREDTEAETRALMELHGDLTHFATGAQEWMFQSKIQLSTEVDQMMQSYASPYQEASQQMESDMSSEEYKAMKAKRDMPLKKEGEVRKEKTDMAIMKEEMGMVDKTEMEVMKEVKQMEEMKGSNIEGMAMMGKEEDLTENPMKGTSTEGTMTAPTLGMRKTMTAQKVIDQAIEAHPLGQK